MMVTNKTDERLQRRYARFQKKVGEEYQLEEALLKDRPIGVWPGCFVFRRP